jgi:hypothetical protein
VEDQDGLPLGVALVEIVHPQWPQPLVGDFEVVRGEVVVGQALEPAVRRPEN